MKLIYKIREIILRALAKINLALLIDKRFCEFELRSVFINLWLKERGVRWKGKVYFNALPRIPIKGSLLIGKNCSFGENTSFYLHEKLVIGDNFLGAPGVSFISGDHDSESLAYQGQAIVVGDDVWCGYETLVLAGAIIGNKVRFGARSVVTKGEYTSGVFAGIPAKRLKKEALINK